MLPNHAPLYGRRALQAAGGALSRIGSTSASAARREPTRAPHSAALPSGDRAPTTISSTASRSCSCWKTGEFPEGHPFRAIRVMPEDAPVPPIWLLGSSDYSAELAGRGRHRLRLRASFRQPRRGRWRCGRYREGFQPSRWLERPHAILATAAIAPRPRRRPSGCGDAADYSHVRRARGEYGPLVSPEEALAYPWTEEEERAAAGQPRAPVRRPPDRVRERLDRPRERRGRGRADDHERRCSTTPPGCGPTSCWRGRSSCRDRSPPSRAD